MTSQELLELLNTLKYSDNLLEILKSKGFAITDKTTDGDSILHVFISSRHFNQYSRYLDLLVKSGADTNAVNAQGISVLQQMWAAGANHRELSELLSDPNLEVSQVDDKKVSLCEKVFASSMSFKKEVVKLLVSHPKFDFEQKTSLGEPLLFLVNLEQYDCNDVLKILADHPKFNPNVVNAQGETLVTCVLRHNGYRDLETVTILTKHKDFEVNKLDKNGKNYLQECLVKRDYLAFVKLFINVGIKFEQSIIDLIVGDDCQNINKADALFEICCTAPHLMATTLRDGKSLLAVLFLKASCLIDYVKLATLCRAQPNGEAVLAAMAKEVIADFKDNKMTSYVLKEILKQFKLCGIAFDIDYILAVAVINDIYGVSFKEYPEADFYKVIQHIKAITPEDSPEQTAAVTKLKYEVFKSKFKLDCYEEEFLKEEESWLRNKLFGGNESNDISMFGHLFSLEGRVPVGAGLVTLTGSHCDVMGAFMLHLMSAYVGYCEKTNKYSDHLDAIKQVRNMTVKSFRYYGMTKFGGPYRDLVTYNTNMYASMLNDCRHASLEIFTGWPGHAIGLIIHGNSLTRANGGGCSTDATTEEYEITKPDQLTVEVLERLVCKNDEEGNKTFIQRDLHELLGLKLRNKKRGKFQTVGNCGFESKRIALLTKYELFLPADMAQEIYKDTLAFFESFYLAEFINRYKHAKFLPHLLMRLILTNSVVGKDLIAYFKTDEDLEIMQLELMMARFRLQFKNKSTDDFDKTLVSLGVAINTAFSPRTILLDKILTNQLKPTDLDNISTWPSNHLEFQGYHFMHLCVMNDDLALAAIVGAKFPLSVNGYDWEENEPLCYAKSAAMVELLVGLKADVKRKKYDNPLDFAIKAQRLDVVIALIKAGAVLSEYSVYYAASKGSEILNILLESFPNSLDTQTHNHRRPLHAAVAAGQRENVRTLIYYGGANPDQVDVNGISPAELAMRGGKLDIARDLIQNPLTLFRRPNRGDSVVDGLEDQSLKGMIFDLHAQREADRVCFEDFMKTDPGVIHENIDKLIIAIRFRSENAIRGFFIVHPNERVTTCSKHYSASPLADAILILPRKTAEEKQKRLAIIRLLLQTPGININDTIGTTEPLLFMATSMDDPEVLALFLADPKLDPNKQDNIGYTALHDAAERGHVKCVELLLADPRTDSTIKNEELLTADQVVKYGIEAKACKQMIQSHQSMSEPNKSSRLKSGSSL